MAGRGVDVLVSCPDGMFLLLFSKVYVDGIPSGQRYFYFVSVQPKIRDTARCMSVEYRLDKGTCPTLSPAKNH